MPLPTAPTSPGEGRNPGQGLSHRIGAHLKVAGPAGSGVKTSANSPGPIRSEHANPVSAHPSQEAPRGCAGNLCLHGKETESGHSPGAERNGGLMCWEPNGSTSTGQHPACEAQQSQLSPGPALPCWPGNWLLRKPACTPGPAVVPGGRRRMQPPVAPRALGRQSLS